MSHRVTLMTRPGCSACEVAEADLLRICTELGVPLQVRDVDADRELRAEYGDRVPVILINDAEHGFWKVEEPRLRQALLTAS